MTYMIEFVLPADRNTVLVHPSIKPTPELALEQFREAEPDSIVLSVHKAEWYGKSGRMRAMIDGAGHLGHLGNTAAV